MSTPGCFLTMAWNRFSGVFPIIRKIKESGLARGVRETDVAHEDDLTPPWFFCPKSHQGNRGQAGHWGLREWQIWSCWIIWWENFTQRSLGNKFHEVELDLDGVLFLGEPQTLGDPAEMRVHKDTRHPEGVPGPRWRSCGPRPAGSPTPPGTPAPGR